MDISEVVSRVQKISSLPNDGGCEFHLLEDELYLDVLKAIASGCSDSSGLARAALKLSEVDGDRWYE